MAGIISKNQHRMLLITVRHVVLAISSITLHTVAFTAKNRKAIAELAAQQAADFGDSSEIEMILGFNCLQHDDLTSADIAKVLYGRLTDDDKKTTVYNVLAWYALEEVARAYCDLLEQGLIWGR